jgi:hypothetical protein
MSSTQDPDRASTPMAQAPHTGVTFLCPNCDHELAYAGTRPAAAESDTDGRLDDYFICPAGCGTFEHDRTTHRMRRVD